MDPWSGYCQYRIDDLLREASPDEIWDYMHPSPQIIEGFGHPEGADKSRLYVEGQTVDVCRIGYRRDGEDCLDIDECLNPQRNGCHQERSICVNTKGLVFFLTAHF